jgi:lysophospholipase L1-like esterase
VFPSGPFDPRYGQYRNEGGVFYPPVPTRVESAEEVRDIIGAALRAGTNVSIVVDDSGDTITISATGGGGGSYTDEQVRDAVAAALRAGTGVTITNDDAGDTITIAATGVVTGLAEQRAVTLARAKGSAMVRQMTAAPPYAPLLMDSPPVVTHGTSVTSGLTATYGAERVRWTGPLSATPALAGAMQPRGTTSGTTGDANWNARAAEMWFDFDGRYLDLNMRCNASVRYRVWIDGEAATPDFVPLPSGTNANGFVKFDFGAARRERPRRILIEWEDQSAAIQILAIRANPTDYLAPSPGGQRWIWVGDSQARGTGPTRESFAYARTVGRMLGITDFWHIVSSAPGTGLVHANDASIGNYGSRAQYDVIPYLRAGDMLVVQGSVNDYQQAGNVGPALAAYVEQVRAAVPDVGIIVTGLAYIGTPDADRTTINTELKNKAAELGLPFVDPLDPLVFGGTGRSTGPTGDGPADWGRAADYTHFTDAGAWVFGRRLAALIGRAVGIPTGDLKLNRQSVGTLTPALPSATYFYPVSAGARGTSAMLGNSNMRAAPWQTERSVSLARIGVDISGAGQSGAVVRLGVYADNGQGYPGALLVDAGTVAADTTGVKEATIALALPPGLYWLVACVQDAPTTQPTVRTVANWTPDVPIGLGTGTPVADAVIVGYAAGAPAAFPASFPTGNAGSGSAARVFLRTA